MFLLNSNERWSHLSKACKTYHPFELRSEAHAQYVIGDPRPRGQNTYVETAQRGSDEYDTNFRPYEFRSTE